MPMNYGDTIPNGSFKFFLISEAELSSKEDVRVYKEKLRPNVYHVCINDVVTHPELDADAALRALSNYLHNEAFLASKLN